MTSNVTISDDYWPYPLRQIADEKPLGSNLVVVAEISQPWGTESYRHLYTALAPPEALGQLLNHPGGIGHKVSTSGPHPARYQGSFSYEPRFAISANRAVSGDLEPLVVGWEAGGRTVLLPDQGFLMTYGLVPRSVQSKEGDVIHWDDPTTGQHDIVVAKMVSKFHYELQSEARVSIDRDYLQDYATVRNRSLVQVFYASNLAPLQAEEERLLCGNSMQEFKLKGRLVDIRIDLRDKTKLLAQVWGVRHVLDPAESPIIDGRWDYGELVWPGIEGVVTDRRTSRMWERVYVRDDVLRPYEEYPDRYSIHPESGGVSFGGQWSVGHCRRVFRDLIQVDIKKLYEGCPPEVVRHWHDYAVEPPAGRLGEFDRVSNVASRSKRIVYALVAVGETLTALAARLTMEKVSSDDFVKLSRRELDYYGWWTGPCVPPITRHVPLAMGESAFGERCKDLNSLIIEGLSESKLRKLLAEMHVESKLIKDFGSLKLLDTLIQLATISRQSGLSLSDCDELERRRKETVAALPKGKFLETPTAALFALYDLRINASHRSGDINELMQRLGIDPASTEAGWGEALDHLYDAVGAALEDISNLLCDFVS
jgi:hypothetical protein